jgi:serine protease Do
VLIYRSCLASLLFGSALAAGAVVSGPAAVGIKTKEAVAVVRPATVNIKALRRNGTSYFQSIGSGFLITTNGYILTNEHVVGDSQSIEVTLWKAGGKNYIGKLVKVDKQLDLALVRIKPRNGETFPTARVNDQIRVRTGDRVIAIGNPFGLSHSVTSGVVGATGRSLSVGTVNYTGLIQTDAPINQGNSGGPLVNLRGDVVGINSAILANDTEAGAFSGQGFAIPIDVAMGFANEVTRVGI